jgi:hypothetical protein
VPKSSYESISECPGPKSSNWYSFKKAVALKNDYEINNGITYDAVLSSRIDMGWKESILFNKMDQKFIWHSNIILYENNFKYFYPQGFSKLSSKKKNCFKRCVQSYPETNHLWDAWFFSSSAIINDIATIYDSFKFFATYRGLDSKISHHKILFDFFEHKKYLPLLKSYKDYTYYFPVRLSFEKFSVYLLQKQDLSIFDKRGCSKRKLYKKILNIFKK